MCKAMPYIYISFPRSSVQYSKNTHLCTDGVPFQIDWRSHDCRFLALIKEKQNTFDVRAKALNPKSCNLNRKIRTVVAVSLSSVAAIWSNVDGAVTPLTTFLLWKFGFLL